VVRRDTDTYRTRSTTPHLLRHAVRVLVLTCLCGSCDKPSDPTTPEVYLDLDDPVPAHDAYLTWRNYTDIYDRTERAVYVWNGEELGQGPVGLQKVIHKLEGLRPASWVLVYPRYNLTWQLNRVEPAPLYPFVNDYERIRRILLRNRITFAFSPRDHNGKLLPECVPPKQK
jgi:hypothetical protein